MDLRTAVERANRELGENADTFKLLERARELVIGDRVAWADPLPVGHPGTKIVLDEVLAERLRQEQLRAAGKFLWTCADPTKPNSEKLAVLSEEFGEVAREVTELVIARDKFDARGSAVEVFNTLHGKAMANLRKELIQVAAVAVAWAEALKP